MTLTAPDPTWLPEASGSAGPQGGTVPWLAVGNGREQWRGRTPRQLNLAAGSGKLWSAAGSEWL